MSQTVLSASDASARLILKMTWEIDMTIIIPFVYRKPEAYRVK